MSLHRAKIGDISLLLERLRDGSELLDAERHWIADLVEGKKRRPQNRPPKFSTVRRHEDMVEEFLLQKALRLEPKAAERVASDFKVSASFLHRVHATVKEDGRAYAAILRRVVRREKAFRTAYGYLLAIQEARRGAIQYRWDRRREARARQQGEQ